MPNYRRFNSIFWSALILSVFWSLSLIQPPLFSSNQNSYLLKGISGAAPSLLTSDWLAKQTDHILAFSEITKMFYRIDQRLFFVGHFFLAVLFIFSLFQIFRKFYKMEPTPMSVGLFFSVCCIALIRSPQLFDGVAGQYILGPYFQPSAFGVLLISSIAFFVYDRPIFSIISLCLSAWLHPTYLLQAGFILIAYVSFLVSEKRWVLAFICAGIFLLTVTPLVFILNSAFGGALPEELFESQRILALERIPHHAVVSNWISNQQTLLVTSAVLAAVLLYRKNKLVTFLLGVPLLITLCLTVICWETRNYFLALLFPWRSSTWMMPVSITLLGSFFICLIQSIFSKLKFERLNSGFVVLTILFCGFCAVNGLMKTLRNSQRSQPLVYKHLNSIASSGGSFLIPIFGENIRLNAMVPVFVDWKSHPYKAEEVIQWDNRIHLAKAFYEAGSFEEQVNIMRKILAIERISYILFEKMPATLSKCRPVFYDKDIFVFKISDCFKNF